MAQLTEPQVMEFTDDLDKIAVAIGHIRQSGKLGNGHRLSEEEKDSLLLSQIKLLRASAKFSAQAISLNADAIKDQLEMLRLSALEIDKTLAKIDEVQKILDFSAMATAVAAAVASGNILDVSESLAELLAQISITRA